MKYHQSKIHVRLNEVDIYQVAWHGHYVAWMEVGRCALTEQFGLGALQLAASGFLGPVVSLEIKYLHPARYNDELTVYTRLKRAETATLVFESIIKDAAGKKLASGYTTHALTDMNGTLQFQMPQQIAERVQRMAEWLETA